LQSEFAVTENIVFFLSLSFILTQFLYGAQADTVKAPDIKDELPVIDGLPDDVIWKAAQWQPIDQVWINYNEAVDSADFYGHYKVLWSSETNLLYFLFEVTDDAFVDGYVYDNDDYFNYDIIEIFLDQDKSGGLHVFDGSGSVAEEWGTNAENAFAYHVNADLPADGQVKHDFTVCDIAGTSWSDKKTMNYASHFPDFAFRKNDGKYYWELSLKVYDDSYNSDYPDSDSARVTLKTGDIMGLSAAYCDNDDPAEDPKERDNFFGSVWVPEERNNDHWKNADDFGTLMLTQNDGAEKSEMTIGSNFWDQAWGGSDPWKNGYQNAVAADSVDNPDYNPWKAVFIDEISFYSVLRFMDFGRINDNHDEIHWNDRVKKDALNQQRMAIDWMIDICNRTHTDMWICMPELTVEDYWRNAALLIKEKLNPDLKVYIEWSNETWNSMFSAYQTGIDSGKVYDLWFPDDEGTSWGEKRLSARYTVFTAAKIWSVFNDIFGDEAAQRVVKVLAGSVADDWWDAALANALADETVNPGNILPDVFGIAPYVGNGLNGSDPDILEKMNAGISDAESSILKVRSVLDGTNEWSGQMPPHPGVSGLNMVCYEGGQHIQISSSSFAVNPGAYNWYMNYLDMLEKHISGPYMNYTHSGNWGNMAWGAKNNIGQPAVEAPKFMALNNWYILHNKENPGPQYNLTVNKGSGSGSYYAGMYVIIKAQTDTSGLIFDKWIGDTNFVADIYDAVTVVTLKDVSVEISATYKKPDKTTRFEAEDADMYGVNTSSSREGYSGTGYVDGSTFDQDGDKIIFTVNAETAGSYNLRIGYGGFYGDKHQYIYVNGEQIAYFQFPETNEWATIDFGSINLLEGSNTVSIVKSWGWMDIDFIELDGDGITSVMEKKSRRIVSYRLYNNYPNPFNPQTRICYQIPHKSLVTLKIYDLLGREIKTLVNKEQNEGLYDIKWNGENLFGQSVSSGVYLFRLKVGDYCESKKMTLLR